MNNLNTLPADPKLIEAVVLACLEKNPIDFQKVDEDEVKRVVAAIKRATTPKGAALKYTVTRKNFLCGCLDFTEKLPEEHLIVGYGFRRGNTTDIERIHQERARVVLHPEIHDPGPSRRLDCRSQRASAPRLQRRGPVPAILRAGSGSLLSRGKRLCESVPAPAAVALPGAIEPAELSATARSEAMNPWRHVIM
jgi:hypothetical protein